MSCLEVQVLASLSAAACHRHSEWHRFHQRWEVRFCSCVSVHRMHAEVKLNRKTRAAAAAGGGVGIVDLERCADEVG